MHFGSAFATCVETLVEFFARVVQVSFPVILTYSAWSYWVFRGKVRGELGYH
jgi:cytochrome d ubiquinol oxidase subunit II